MYFFTLVIDFVSGYIPELYWSSSVDLYSPDFYKQGIVHQLLTSR